MIYFRGVRECFAFPRSTRNDINYLVRINLVVTSPTFMIYTPAG